VTSIETKADWSYVFACPGCSSDLMRGADEWRCTGCGSRFAVVAGIRDLRHSHEERSPP
jgi:hypothetical protein